MCSDIRTKNQNFFFVVDKVRKQERESERKKATKLQIWYQCEPVYCLVVNMFVVHRMWKISKLPYDCCRMSFSFCFVEILFTSGSLKLLSKYITHINRYISHWQTITQNKEWTGMKKKKKIEVEIDLKSKAIFYFLRWFVCACACGYFWCIILTLGRKCVYKWWKIEIKCNHTKHTLQKNCRFHFCVFYIPITVLVQMCIRLRASILIDTYNFFFLNFPFFHQNILISLTVAFCFCFSS